MINLGKSINLFLIDGAPRGRIKCTLANWTGVVYKVPRVDLEKCKSRDDFKQSGVYMLFGTSPETDAGVVYIGQAGTRNKGEGILYRLIEHKRSAEKDYWKEAVVITTSNNTFGQTDISYLENRFYMIAKEVGRCDIKNANMPALGNVTEEKKSELEEFIEFSKIAIGVLGYKLLENYIEDQDTNTDIVDVQSEDVIFQITSRTTDAKGKRTPEGFVVLKGSKINTRVSSSCPNNTKVEREKYQLIFGNSPILERDVLLNSPAEAACFVTGYSTNARTAWKTSDGKTLNDVEANESRIFIDEINI